MINPISYNALLQSAANLARELKQLPAGSDEYPAKVEQLRLLELQLSALRSAFSAPFSWL